MLDELKKANKVVGIKQSLKAIEAEKVIKAFIAKDAEERLVARLKEQCMNLLIEIEYVDTMKELGKACGIDVGTAVAVVIKS